MDRVDELLDVLSGRKAFEVTIDVQSLALLGVVTFAAMLLALVIALSILN